MEDDNEMIESVIVNIRNKIVTQFPLIFDKVLYGKLNEMIQDIRYTLASF